MGISKSSQISMTKGQKATARELWNVEEANFGCGHLLELLAAIRQGLDWGIPPCVGLKGDVLLCPACVYRLMGVRLTEDGTSRGHIDGIVILMRATSKAV